MGTKSSVSYPRYVDTGNHPVPDDTRSTSSQPVSVLTRTDVVFTMNQSSSLSPRNRSEHVGV